MDVSKIANRSVVKFGMEIFAAYQFVQFAVGDRGGDNGVVFLSVLGFVFVV